MTTSAWNPWDFRDRAEMVREGRTVTGFKVHAVDGDIGKVDSVTTDPGDSHLVVDTGHWIFGRKVMLPAGTVERVDWDGEKVHVDRTKDQIRHSPEHPEPDEGSPRPAYRERMEFYYRDFYGV